MAAGVGRWNGGRELREREKVWENELFNLLRNFNLTEGFVDKWKWNGIPKGEFSMKAAYKELAGSHNNIAQRRRKIMGFHGIWKTSA